MTRALPAWVRSYVDAQERCEHCGDWTTEPPLTDRCEHTLRAPAPTTRSKEKPSMTTTPTRPEEVDEHGTRHRHGCTQPGWTIEAASVRGFAWARCNACSAVRLARTKETP